MTTEELMKALKSAVADGRQIDPSIALDIIERQTEAIHVLRQALLETSFYPPTSSEYGNWWYLVRMPALEDTHEFARKCWAAKTKEFGE